MALSISRLRRWFALGVILMIATVAGMYFYAQMRLRHAIHEIPAKMGINIQQTAEGFSISKSAEGRTQFTVSAAKAVQFKEGGRAELHNVKIVVYGKDSSRFDRIAGDDFDYDPASGNVSAQGKVLIDLEANPEGPRHSDQTPPAQTRTPLHLETNGLVFNKNTGDASAAGRVVFQTPQATGSAVGVEYVAKTGTLNLLSKVAVTVNRPQPVQVNAARGVITKQPRQIVLTAARMTREQQQSQSDHATFFLRDDNTVDRILAEGDVESEIHGQVLSKSKSKPKSNSEAANAETRVRSDRAEMWLTGARNQLRTAILSGNVHLVSQGAENQGTQDHGTQDHGAQPTEAFAGRVTLNFAGNSAGQQVLKTVHAEDGVRLSQMNVHGGTGSVASSPAKGSAQNQNIEMTAPVMDFIVKDGHLLDHAETSGPPQIVIAQPATNQRTVVTAAKFTAKFTANNRLATLHGEPDAKIVNSGAGDSQKRAPGQADRVSTSQMLDVIFLPEGGIKSITQSGGVAYADGAAKAWADRGEYTTADQMLVLTGSPRVVDTGTTSTMTTTAQTIRVNRITGDALAEGNVKSTYSDLKAQPDGAMLASSDPIHVTSRSMTAHRSPSVALYTGDARLWQKENVVEAPTLQFDRDHRSLIAQGADVGTGLRPVQAGQSPATTQDVAQPVSTVLVQVDKNGKVTPIHIASARLNYADTERRVFLDGGVTAKGSDATLTGEQMTFFLLPRSKSAAAAGPGAPGQVERIVAEHKVVITQPTRHATGERLVYTSADDKFVLTGGPFSGPPSIFDAERGKITGDLLTFFRHDDRVLVEGNKTSPTLTKTQVAR
jgi:lipopolysaccharide export system protein LptA